MLAQCFHWYHSLITRQGTPSCLTTYGNARGGTPLYTIGHELLLLVQRCQSYCHQQQTYKVDSHRIWGEYKKAGTQNPSGKLYQQYEQ